MRTDRSRKEQHRRRSGGRTELGPRGAASLARLARRRTGWAWAADSARAAGHRLRADHAARHPRPAPARPGGPCWRPAHRLRPAAGADRGRRGRHARSSWTSRSPRRAAWARTACSSAPPAPARANCCARWCSALALTHSSETLNFVLVDFKGGATFLGLDELPHTSAVITNLADEVALVDRMQDALHGELMRRQELLRAAGNYTSALEYETGPRRRRRRWTRCPPCSSWSTSSASCSPPTASSWTCSS